MNLRRFVPVRMIRVVVVIALVTGLWQAAAQLPTATILGVVRDPSGAVMPEVSLTARNVETGQTRKTVAGADGSYRFAALPVGSYEVRVEHPGFQSEVRSGLTLAVAQEAVVNFTLQVGAVEQTVAVTTEAPLVNTTSGSLGGLVDEQRIADLPLNGRNYVDLTLLQPGIQQHRNMNRSTSTVGTWYSSNGAPLRSNNYLLDGAPIRDFSGATSSSATGSTLGVEGIREYRIITNFFSAEYGLSMGSQMVVVSKNGTNNLHGSLFEYLRNSALDARNFFDLKSAATPPDFRLPPYKRNSFGGSVGGPIRKDKTFYHLVYEGLRDRLGVTSVANVMSASCRGPASATITSTACPQLNPPAGTVTSVTIAPLIAPWLALYPDPNLPNNQFTYPASQPTREDFGQVRVDQNLSGNDSFFVRYTAHDTDRASPLAFPQFGSILTSRGQYANLSENHVFSPTLLNTFRFSYVRTRVNNDSPSGLIGPQYSFVPGKEFGGISIAGLTGIGPEGNTPSVKKQNLFTWSDDMFYTRGRHSLKFGTLINRFQQYTQSGTGNRGSITFPNLAAFLQGRVTSYNAITPGSILDRTFFTTSAGFYLQDDLRVSPRLTLNLGLRYEFLTIPVEVRGLNAALRDIQHDPNTTRGPMFPSNPTTRNWSPRVGFAWDVRGDGKTAVRGGFGLLYDIGNLGSAFVQGTIAMPPFSSSSQVQNPTAFPLPGIPLTFPREAAGREIRVIDYLMQQPHMLQYNLTVERQLPFHMAVTLAYAGSRGINLLQVKEGNPTVPQVLPDGRLFWPAVPTGQLPPRTNPNWGNITLVTAGGNSFYNSLQFVLQKRLSRGLQFQSSYTWSKLIDETQGQLPAERGGSPVTSTHRQLDRGPAAFDVTHSWRLNTIYRLPQLVSSGGVLGKVGNGWWVSGILSLQGGYPFSPTIASDRARKFGGENRPDLVAGRNNDNIILGGPDRYFDPLAFAIQPAGFLGNAGRGILRGPGFANLDFSVAKDTALRFLGESGKLEFRAEFFNLPNRANFAMPSTNVYSAQRDVEAPLNNAARITGTATTSRQIQLALKVLF